MKASNRPCTAEAVRYVPDGLEDWSPTGTHSKAGCGARAADGHTQVPPPSQNVHLGGSRRFYVVFLQREFPMAPCGNLLKGYATRSIPQILTASKILILSTLPALSSEGNHPWPEVHQSGPAAFAGPVRHFLQLRELRLLLFACALRQLARRTVPGFAHHSPVYLNGRAALLRLPHPVGLVSLAAANSCRARSL